MTPLDAAQQIIDARARATAGVWQWCGNCLESVWDPEIGAQPDIIDPTVDCGSYCLGGIARLNISNENKDFIALSANHGATVAQAYIDVMQDNARLRASLKETIECLYEHAVKPDDKLDADQLERDYKRLTAAIDAALEESK